MHEFIFTTVLQTSFFSIVPPITTEIYQSTRKFTIFLTKKSTKFIIKYYSPSKKYNKTKQNKIFKSSKDIKIKNECQLFAVFRYWKINGIHFCIENVQIQIIYTWIQILNVDFVCEFSVSLLLCFVVRNLAIVAEYSSSYSP